MNGREEKRREVGGCLWQAGEIIIFFFFFFLPFCHFFRSVDMSVYASSHKGEVGCEGGSGLRPCEAVPPVWRPQWAVSKSKSSFPPHPKGRRGRGRRWLEEIWMWIWWPNRAVPSANTAAYFEMHLPSNLKGWTEVTMHDPAGTNLSSTGNFQFWSEIRNRTELCWYKPPSAPYVGQDFAQGQRPTSNLSPPTPNICCGCPPVDQP